MPASRTALRASLTKVAGQKLFMEMQPMLPVGMLVILRALLIWEPHQTSAIELTMDNAC
ncbi:MAG: hypothetical protein V2I33_16895 [Kangiellaceae bacterium]|jgi:hypothetical protein|nr:hypothetical protein [Kangiellaceae bacterium]